MAEHALLVPVFNSKIPKQLHQTKDRVGGVTKQPMSGKSSFRHGVPCFDLLVAISLRNIF